MGDPDMADLALGLPRLHQRQDNPGICHAVALHQVDHRAPHAELVLWNFWLLRQKGAAARHRKLRGSGGGCVVRSLVFQDRGRV